MVQQNRDVGGFRGNVFGSDNEITSEFDVRFFLKSGHRVRGTKGLLGAKSGHLAAKLQPIGTLTISDPNLVKRFGFQLLKDCVTLF